MHRRHRQEFLTGEAADTAWIVDRGGSATVPYGKLKNVLTTLEATRLEPGAYVQRSMRRGSASRVSKHSPALRSSPSSSASPG
jgi:hypothetical protein